MTEYLREWRKNNKKRIREYRLRYLERKKNGQVRIRKPVISTEEENKERKKLIDKYFKNE